MLIKICGITNLEDANAAVEAGANALGFNFYVRSPRYISPEAARRIIDEIPADVLTVGVFVNEESAAKVQEIAAVSGVAAVQLHGDESPAFAAQLKQHQVIKAFGVNDGFEPTLAAAFPANTILLDAFDRRLHGGTGRTIDWSIARATRELVPRLILAGGLSAENVAAAIAKVRPYGVDACSALESSPGKKDHEHLRSFVVAARSSSVQT